jgi:thioredoxin domain-containing protein 5
VRSLVNIKIFIFIQFYYNSHFYSKRLVPTWQQLAEKFVGDDTIKIAKIDCSVGENRDVCSEQEVNGFPTIFLYKNGNKVSEYHGNRGLEDMYDFVKSQASGEVPRDEL